MSVQMIHTVHVAIRLWAEDETDAIKKVDKLLLEQRVVQPITSHNIYRVTDEED